MALSYCLEHFGNVPSHTLPAAHFYYNLIPTLSHICFTKRSKVKPTKISVFSHLKKRKKRMNFKCTETKAMSLNFSRLFCDCHFKTIMIYDNIFFHRKSLIGFILTFNFLPTIIAQCILHFRF